MIASLIVSIPVLLIIFICFLIIKRKILRKQLMKEYELQRNGLIVSFFHPYCNSGGGGERVLWTGISALLQRSNNLFLFIYTNDKICLSSPDGIFKQVKKVFGLDIEALKCSNRIRFVPLRSEPLLRAEMYPHFTLLGQALGSMVTALEAVIRCPSDVFIDTTGFAFTMPVFSWVAGAVCGAYIHFPTISSDMENRVRKSSLSSPQSGTGYNNAEKICNSNFLTNIKLIYYFIFKRIYGFMGNATICREAAVNSSWTRKHIYTLWGRMPLRIYPPCPAIVNCDAEKVKKPWILSIGQFRPEKNHRLQIEAFHRFLGIVEMASKSKDAYRLILAGGCRNNDDYARVQTLRELVKHLHIESQIVFKVNITSDELQELLHHSTVNLHTMVDEHFGIGIVEGMAAGLVTVANCSGGPLTDIIGPARAYIIEDHNQLSSANRQPPVGFLASTVSEYADTFYHIFVTMQLSDRRAIGQAAHRRAIHYFSESAFCEGWLKFVAKLGL